MDYNELISLVQVDNIRLVDGVCRTKISSPEQSDNSEAEIAYGVHLLPLTGNGKLIYRAVFRFYVRPISTDSKATPPGELVDVRATFELVYSLPTEVAPPDDATLKNFGDVSVLFNAWPYWREYLQAGLVRMQLPPLMVPLLKPGQQPLKQKQNEDGEQNK